MKAIILTALFFITLCISAQRPLEYDTITKEGEVYPLGKNEISRITISSSINIRPYFKSMGNVQVIPAEIDTLGTEVYYHLHLEVLKRNDENTLEIKANGFSPLYIPLTLNPNGWYRYFIYDPDSTIVNCYNQLTREGSNLFKNGNYEDAKKKYEASMSCSDVTDEEKKEANSQLMVIDTLIVWKNMANTYFTDGDYLRTIEYCKKILAKNSADNFIRSRNIEAESKQSEICRIDFMKAENYFEDDDLENAKIFYKRVISLGGHNTITSDARIRLQEIENIEKNKKQLSHVLTYEYSENAPIGISTGNYKEHKVSGYFSLRLNTEVFEAFRSNNRIESKPELNVSFGWTVKIVKPVWLFFGSGYTGVGEYVYKDEPANIDEDMPEAPETTLKIHNAISPEVGLLGKVKIAKGIGIALRYTFQYRFALKKDMEDYMGKTKHVFGVGFCF